jgi:nucleotide-binding universal stress UspA family protein
MRRLLIPLDGSKFSETVLTHIEILVKHYNAEIVLLRVVPFLWPSGFIHVREMGDKLDKEASNYLFAINAKLRGKGIEGDFFVREGNVAEAICDFAKDNGIDLIAMTSHGRGGVRRWALGSVADKVVQSSPVPILLYRIRGDRIEDCNYKKILIPIDGSKFSENIFPQASKFVETFNSKISFLHVMDTRLTENFAAAKDIFIYEEETAKQGIRDYFISLENRAKESKVTHELLIEKGDPAEVICDFAEKNEVDLIAMSTHGRSSISRWALGSVADRVLRGSSKPILLIRAKEQE